MKTESEIAEIETKSVALESLGYPCVVFPVRIAIH